MNAFARCVSHLTGAQRTSFLGVAATNHLASALASNASKDEITALQLGELIISGGCGVASLAIIQAKKQI
jgi:hypothetical protein